MLHKNPSKCALFHNNKHVVKMILETAQILCTTHWVTGSEAPYKKTHVNHPSCIWVRESIENYRWLVNLGLCLCEEYTYRYEKIHKTEDKLLWLAYNEPSLPNIKMTKIKLVMPDRYKNIDPVKAYRNYYIGEKQHMAQWKNRPVPKWFYFNKEN